MPRITDRAPRNSTGILTLRAHRRWALAAESGVAIFRVGFELWISPGETRDFATCIAAASDELKALTASP